MYERSENAFKIIRRESHISSQGGDHGERLHPGSLLIGRENSKDKTNGKRRNV